MYYRTAAAGHVTRLECTVVSSIGGVSTAGAIKNSLWDPEAGWG